MNRVSTSRLHELEISNTGQHLTYDGGREPLEAMLEPTYFLPASHRLGAGYLIEVFWKDEDGWLLRYARLRVLRVLPEGIYCTLEGEASYGRPDLEASEPEPDPSPKGGTNGAESAEPAKVSWGGPAHKWRIVDAAGSVISKGHASQEAAEAALEALGKPEAA